MNSIKANNFYTGCEFRQNAVINFNGTTIVSIGEKASDKICEEYHTITPAFIDPHSHIGMCREGEPASEDEANEHFDTILALADALDSVQMDDSAFKDSIEAGVLYSCVLPGSGNIIGGQSAFIKNYARDTNSALICRTGMKAAFGYNPMSTINWKGTRPQTRMGCLAVLRNEFLEIKDKSKSKKEADKLNPRQKVLKELLDRKTILRVHVHKTDDIAALLRFTDEFKIKITVEHAGDVHDLETFENLAKRGISVIYGPVDSFGYKVELKHKSWKNIRFLLKSGVKFGLMSDHPVVLQEQLFCTLRYFLRLGVSKASAVEILTKDNAEILGVDKFLGTLEKGKWASFVCWNGDPFEMSSYPVAVFAEGRKIFGV